MTTAKLEDFFTLTPERLLDSVERALDSSRIGVRATGRTMQLNSMENRVYEIELDGPLAPSGAGAGVLDAKTCDFSRVVTKFYRPGRWSREAILEEHEFLADLVAAEVPAVAPLPLANGSTLDISEDGIFFSVFPKVRGRLVPELDDSRLAQSGRLLGRLHNVGSKKKAAHRLALTPETYGWKALEFLEKSGLVDEKARAHHKRLVTDILKTIEPMFSPAPKTFRIHGDCHLGNVLWQDVGPFFLDFDDMLTGPAVQDVWLVVRGRDTEAIRQREVLLHGYEQMREFDRTELKLIEPLRALRMINYSAWIARRWDDPSFKNTFPDFGIYKYWVEEMADLEEQLRIIREGPAPPEFGDADWN